ncbi:MAG TPA: class I SAM-dependent methyltransferase, partial [Desulfobacteraceae bacterium]|nr:class I SAM-dependent methyltransferase [Desulfobacteraceae bacterium]
MTHRSFRGWKNDDSLNWMMCWSFAARKERKRKEPLSMNTWSETARYLQACKNPFWRQVFKAELDYLLRHLRPGDEILSVGCGPAVIEKGLAEHGFSILGLDVSQEAIACAPDTLRTVVASAEKMPFADSEFEVVLFIVSLQFVENYRQALAEARRVLRPGGRVIAMLLNPASDFFNAKSAQADSY